MVVCTNNLFDINSTEDGTWRRIKITKFESKFVDNPVSDDPDEPYQFLKDRTLEEKIDGWIPVFMNMLVERAYKTEGIVKDCTAVTEISDSYRNDQDYINSFMKEKIKEDPEEELVREKLANALNNGIIQLIQKLPLVVKHYMSEWKRNLVNIQNAVGKVLRLF